MIRLLNRAQHVHNGASYKRGRASYASHLVKYCPSASSAAAVTRGSLARVPYLFRPAEALRYDRTSYSRASSKLLALSRYQSRPARLLLFLARDRAIAGAGRRNLRANETICGRTHILSAPVPLLFPPRAYVGHVFRRYTFEDIDRRVSPSVAVAAATLPAGNYSYSLFGRGECIEQKPSREMQNAVCMARREGNGARGMRAAVESIT